MKKNRDTAGKNFMTTIVLKLKQRFNQLGTKESFNLDRWEKLSLILYRLFLIFMLILK